MICDFDPGELFDYSYDMSLRDLQFMVLGVIHLMEEIHRRGVCLGEDIRLRITKGWSYPTIDLESCKSSKESEDFRSDLFGIPSMIQRSFDEYGNGALDHSALNRFLTSLSQWISALDLRYNQDYRPLKRRIRQQISGPPSWSWGAGGGDIKIFGETPEQRFRSLPDQLTNPNASHRRAAFSAVVHDGFIEKSTKVIMKCLKIAFGIPDAAPCPSLLRTLYYMNVLYAEYAGNELDWWQFLKQISLSMADVDLELNETWLGLARKWDDNMLACHSG